MSTNANHSSVAAFSPTCSNGHIPKYIRQSSEKETGDIFVITVNDIFVVNAWAEWLDPGRKSKVRFVADPTGEYVDKLGVLFDATKFFGNKRGHRSAIVVKDGKVVKHEIEEDPLKTIDVSSADKILA